MKHKSIILLALLLATSTLWAQHLTFKGVPITGAPKALSDQLQKKGLHAGITASDGTLFLSGTFATIDDCDIAIHSNEQGQSYLVVVFFPGQKTWGELRQRYQDIKSLLTQKYGMPGIVLEHFDSDIVEKSNYLALNAIEKNETTYGSAWQLDNGTIELAIIYAAREHHVVLRYTDSAGQQQTIQQALEDL